MDNGIIETGEPKSSKNSIIFNIELQKEKIKPILNDIIKREIKNFFEI